MDNQPIGILRYNLFWDNIPFCNLLYIDENYQKSGYGKQLMQHWEDDMKRKGYIFVLVSTQVDESAQHFYRKLDYHDCGGLLFTVPALNQPMELFMGKSLV